MSEPYDAAKIIEECRSEVQECRSEVQGLRRELYGNPQLGQKGVYERLNALEESGRLERIEATIRGVELRLQINNVYLKGLVWGGAAVMVPVVGAGILALFSYLGSG